jgi:MFS-type transporter involved in bile tolerance (Atg22 family)
MSALEGGVGHHRQDHERGSSKDTTTLNDEGYNTIDDGEGGGGGSATTTQQPRRRRRRRRRARAAAAAAAIVPRMFLFADIDGAPPEATGLALCSIARGAAAMSTIFLGPALLRLAQDASVCDDDGSGSSSSSSSCRVYGMRPTSLLANIGVFGGLLSTALTPLFGAIVDHTPHRLHVGRISASILSVVKGVEAFVGRSTWPAVAALQVANMAVYNAYLVAAYAYTAELSRKPDDQTAYNSRFQMAYYVSMLAFLVSVMTVSACLGLGDVGTARVSQGLAFAACASAFCASWGWYFRPRPALGDVPPGGSLVGSGYDRLSSTLRRVRRDDRRRAVKYFLLSASLSEAATSALATISTTYMSHVLGMDARQIGTAFLCVFASGIPGSYLGGCAGSRLNPLRSATLCLALLAANTTAAAFGMRGPEDRNAMYAFAAVWGVCLAWLHPTHASLYCTIIPRGQEGEVNSLTHPSCIVLYSPTGGKQETTNRNISQPKIFMFL